VQSIFLHTTRKMPVLHKPDREPAMNRLLAVVLIVIGGFTARISAGEKPATEEEVRQVIERSLPFVEKDGVAWIKKRDCMSCHVVTFMLWAHAEARAHGIRVDDKKTAEWTEWSMNKSLAARVFFKLDDKVVQSLPEAIQPKLSHLVGQGFTHEAEFVAALGKELTPDELKQHHADLIKQAMLKRGASNDGGGLDTMAQLFLARDSAVKDAKADFYAGLADLIVGLQDADGTWKAGGQLPSRRWSRPTADQTTTLWTILALTSNPDARPAITKSVEKARAAVTKPAEDGNLEWIVARLLYEHKFGTPDQFSAMKQQLLERQNADGGWSVVAEDKSDAFSTGQSLYALRVAGVAPDDAVIRRSQRYLLDTQNEDGSWTVAPALTSNGGPERLKKLEPIWRNWGSSWATIGLAKSLPTK
jgi:hypothetical protein